MPESLSVKRLMFHTASLRGGGAERVFVLMANEMARRGHHVTFVTWNAEGPNASMLLDKVKLVDLGFAIRNEGYRKSDTIKGLFKTVAILRRLRPDAVYSAPEFANLVIAAALLLSACRASFFPSFHAAAALPASGFGARLATWLSRLVSARATKAIAVSRGVGRDIAARGIAGGKIVVINNPLPPLTSRAASAYAFEEKLAAMGDGPVIATLGRLVPVKDHRTLLRAFAELRSTRSARLVIFGDGPLEAELRRYADELGVADHVHFAGYINDPAACYRICDLFVLSSLSEGFANVLIEAMAAGVPVVSTDAPHGPAEILSNGRFGKLVAVGDASALARAIGETLDEPPARDLLTQRAAEFSIDIIGDRYEQLL